MRFTSDVCASSEVIRRTFEELPPAELTDEFSVSGGNLSADGHDARAAFNLPALERAVIDVHMLRLRGDPAPVIRIEHHEVGIGSELNGPLFWEKTEEFRDLRTRDIDHCVEIDFSGFHTVGVQQIDALFQRRNAIGDFGEIVPAHRFLLLEIKWRVIRGDRLDQAVAQSIPEHRLIPRIAERW